MHRKEYVIQKVILFASLCFNVVLVVHTFYKSPNESIIGTYRTGDGIVKSDKHLVFLPDCSYVLYKQFELIEKGNYKDNIINDISVYSLISEDETSEHIILYNSSDAIYFFDDYNGFMTFTKISSTPSFVNLSNFVVHNGIIQ